jgi:hypothetical protein
MSKSKVTTAFVGFVENSTKWCADASESETQIIYTTLDTILADTKRRSSISKQTLEVLTQVQDLLKQHGNDLEGMVEKIRRLTSDQKEVMLLTNPIIEALQFQDRLRQNLENLSKVCKIWDEQQGTLGKDRIIKGDALKEFGERCLKAMTSPEEREIVRQFITGLPEEKKATDDLLLF